MDENNLVLLRGTLASNPVERVLPSGDVVTQLEVTTSVEARRVSVPVAVHRPGVLLVAGDEVVVTGHVHRRFFRTNGVTQSRTEVVAADVIKRSRKRAVERALDALCARALGATAQ